MTINKPLSQREIELTNLLAHVMDEKAAAMRENAALKAHPLKMICEKCGVLTDVDLPNKDSDNAK